MLREFLTAFFISHESCRALTITLVISFVLCVLFTAWMYGTMLNPPDYAVDIVVAKEIEVKNALAVMWCFFCVLVVLNITLAIYLTYRDTD